MARLLYIEANLGKERSASMNEVGKTFLEAYQENHPNDQLDTLDVWNTNLIEIDEAMLNASYAIIHRLNHTPEEAESWEKVVRLVDQFKTADKFLFSVPMWHLGIPYKLKHYLDLLIHPGQTFQYANGERPKGLITGKSAAVIYSRFDGYRNGSGLENFENQKRFMEQALGLIGFTRIHSIVVVEPPPGSLKSSDPDNSQAKDQAIRMGASF
jgi:FMN-dependent NADH-azoreductase